MSKLYKQSMDFKNSLLYPKAMIFDWDNTLVDSHQTIATAINRLYEDYELPTVTLHQIKTSPQHALKDTFPQIFGTQWKEAREKYNIYFKEIHLEMLNVHEGAHDLLDYLSSIDMPLFIVSNKTHHHLEAEIKALNWHHHFHFIRGSLDGRVDKPDPEAIRHALKDSHISPSKEVWFVGDSPVDVECALNANCLPIIAHENSTISRFEYFKEPIVFIDNLLGVKDLLAKCK